MKRHDQVSKKTIALIGNPNVGKTTLFNMLAKKREHVGNWPGKTVEVRQASVRLGKKSYELVDLPGVYSLSAYSEDELVARDYILEKSPELIVQVIDASRLERNLFLTLQLMELDVNLLVILNFTGYAEKKGKCIDQGCLSRLLGIRLLDADLRDKKSIDNIRERILKCIRHPLENNLPEYNDELTGHIDEIEKLLDENGISHTRFDSISLLCHDEETARRIIPEGKDYIVDKANKIRMHIEAIFGEDIEAAISRSRHGVIQGLCSECCTCRIPEVKSRSDMLDKVLTSRIAGIPIFLVILFSVFFISFYVSRPIQKMISELLSLASEDVGEVLIQAGASSGIISFVKDALFAGVGSVIVFIPSIFTLFAGLAVLEDSGYMARAAFVMDSLMHKIGLHGKSFIPFILGFGCNVPAIMAARSLGTRRDKILTILLNPFMSCSARLPVYILFASAFFPGRETVVVFSLYLLGIIVAVFSALLFNKYILKGESSPLVMELPPYRIPTIASIIIHSFEKVKSFVRKAASVILLSVIVIWVLSSIPASVPYASRQSVLGTIGSSIAPIFSPLGFGNWQSSVALMTGFVAKEVIISTLASTYSTEGVGLIQSLRSAFTPASAAAFLVFTLLYIPCISAFWMIKKETGEWKWAVFQAGYSLTVAWMLGFLVYQVGSLL